MVGGLLLKGSRIVIPTSMRKVIMDQIHDGHQGITKCQDRARASVWWPGVTNHIKDLVTRCEICSRERVNRAQPLIPGVFPNLPWQVVGTDLFHFNNCNYLLVVDFYSRYIEIANLSSTTSLSVINHLKSIFARHGIPQTVKSDGGPQYSSFEFRKFAEQYSFEHVTSSPEFAQSNGEAERAVKTCKEILIKAQKSGQDIYLALLAYRTTPIACGYSPSQLLMNRTLRSPLPQIAEKLEPAVPNKEALREKETKYRKQMAKNADTHRGARDLPDLENGQRVHLKSKGKDYTVVASHGTAPRSYFIKGPDGEVLRRNRRHLVVLTQPLPNVTEPITQTGADECMGQTQSSAQITSKKKTNNTKVVPTQVDFRKSERSTKGVGPDRYGSWI